MVYSNPFGRNLHQYFHVSHSDYRGHSFNRESLWILEPAPTIMTDTIMTSWQVLAKIFTPIHWKGKGSRHLNQLPQTHLLCLLSDSSLPLSFTSYSLNFWWYWLWRWYTGNRTDDCGQPSNEETSNHCSCYCKGRLRWQWWWGRDSPQKRK